MRLSPEELNAIHNAIKDLDEDAKIYLFGPRMEDGDEEGEIELLVISSKIGFTDRSSILWDIYEEIGEQKIELHIVASENEDPALVRKVLKEGQLLP